MNLAASRFERAYTRKVNNFGFLLLLAHLPVLCVLAFIMDVSPWTPVWVMILLLAAPAAIIANNRSSKAAGVILGIAAMGVSALTIYVCHGVIEIFVLIAMLAVYGRVLPLIAAAITIALHHFLFWMWFPCSVFNHTSGISTVLIHAFFVVLEVIPVSWIALQFGRTIQVQGIVMEHLGSASDQIHSAAAQVASASQSLAHGASQQAGSIEETSSAIAEINSMAQRNTANATTAAIVADTSVRFEVTTKSLVEMVAAMNRITASSEQISRIVKVIDQIAFQTNILALNAAVEAARAGEAGMGFAVVADEVRSLAKRSAEAAKETATLIEESINNSRAGKDKVDQVTTLFSSISSESARIKSLVEEISLGSSEQSTGITNVSKAIHGIETITQASAASAEETAAAAEQLTAQSKALGSIVDRLAALAGAGSRELERNARQPLRQQFPTRTILNKLPVFKKPKIDLTQALNLSTPAFAAAKALGSSDFPMDDDFKEF